MTARLADHDSSTRSKYTHYLTQKEKQQEKEKQDKKRKAETEAVRELEDKCKRLNTDITDTQTLSNLPSNNDAQLTN